MNLLAQMSFKFYSVLWLCMKKSINIAYLCFQLCLNFMEWRVRLK
jgi:hypothetical protein